MPLWNAVALTCVMVRGTGSGDRRVRVAVDESKCMVASSIKRGAWPLGSSGSSLDGSSGSSGSWFGFRGRRRRGVGMVTCKAARAAPRRG